jgi:transcriptional regulator GlxA family with amidase domain
MNRRDFLAATACAGWAASPSAFRASQAPQAANTPRGANKLAPPEGELIRVACAISKGTTEIDYVGPMAVFETWQRDPASNRPAPKFKIFTVSTSRDPVDGRIADYTFTTVPSPHIVIVPAQSGSPELLDWLRTVHTTADVTMSVCVGARHLALAGLLNGKPATTHHESIDQFAKQFPDVRWTRGVRFVENDKISTGGGLTAGIDLALHIVERYFGRAAAQGVADHLEYDGKRWMVSV